MRPWEVWGRRAGLTPECRSQHRCDLGCDALHLLYLVEYDVDEQEPRARLHDADGALYACLRRTPNADPAG